MNLIFHPEAHEEMLQSARFYETKVSGLGFDFLAAVEQTIHRIHQFPDAGRIRSAPVRMRLVHGFPFTVLYDVQGDRIFIAAVMHASRRPGYWKNRLSS